MKMKNNRGGALKHKIRHHAQRRLQKDGEENITEAKEHDDEIAASNNEIANVEK